MTWGNNSVFQILIIQGSQAVTGLFLYNGLGAPGNPPQFAAVASTVTTDPFGNAITSSKILIQGNVITESGGIFRTAAAAPLIQIDGPHNAVLLYDGSALLAETMASVVTSDGLGNTVQAGFTSYLSNTTYAQLLAAALQFTRTGFTGKPSITSDAAADLALTSGTTAANTQQGALTVLSGAAGAAAALLNGAFELAEVAAPPAVAGGPEVFGSTGGQLHYVSDSNHGDSQEWRTGRIRQSTTATQQFTLASAVAITGLSRALGVGTYHVRLKTFWVPSGVVGSSHTQQFAFTGTATGNVNGQCWQAQAASAVQQASLNAGAGNNLTASLSSPTHVAFPGWTEMDADITVTVAGTLTSTITLVTAGDDITTSAGTYWEITPET